jgi:hypothetical protein
MYLLHNANIFVQCVFIMAILAKWRKRIGVESGTSNTHG